ncbi:MAG: general secretion pathway protein [Flavobacterium sp.]|nr:MAG: general secretion pathway protein [Flavobacterium sp.]
MVWVFLLPSFAILGGLLYFWQSNSDVFLVTILINLAIVGVLMLVNFLVAKFIFKKILFKEALGIGDLLFFIAFALSFPTLAFLNFFIFSLIFSFLVHQLVLLISKRKGNRSQKHSRVPLAGLMAFFLIGVYSAHWTGLFNNLYLM